MSVMARPIVIITDDTTRADLAETLTLLNADAKRISRQGRRAQARGEYDLAHGRIDAVLGELLACPDE